VTKKVPSTLAASFAPTTPPTTTLPITTESTIATSTSIEKIVELVKTMEEMSIQATKLKILKEKVVSLEIDCKLAQIQSREETQKSPKDGRENQGLRERFDTAETPRTN